MATVTALPWVATEISCIDPFDANTLEAASANDYGRAVIFCEQQITGARSPTWAQASTFWFHGMWTPSQGSATSGFTTTALSFYDGATEVFRMTKYGIKPVAELHFWSPSDGGSTLVDNGTVNGTNGTEHTLDIKITAGASATIEVYLSGTLQASFTGLDHTGFTGVTQVVIRGGVQRANWREIICDSVNWIGCRVLNLDPTANGGAQQWSNDKEAIDEIIYSDADTIYTDTNGNVSTFLKSGLDLSAFDVLAIGAGARIKCGASGPQNGAIVLRVGGTNYPATTRALGNGYQALCASWTTDPSTSLPWDSADAESVEFGVKAIT